MDRTCIARLTCHWSCVDQLFGVLQVIKVFWDFRKGLIPIIGGSRWGDD
jgi:hypothetical protein